MKNVSCSCRAGCSGGMFSASKLNQSDSTWGPSATAKPMSAKIAVSSSITWLTGWIVPRGRGRAGSVTSSHSDRSRSSSAASARPDLRARRAASISSFSTFRLAPAALRASGSILPRVAIRALISPFLPRAAMRTASSADSSAAAATAARYLPLSVSIPSITVSCNARPC